MKKELLLRGSACRTGTPGEFCCPAKPGARKSGRTSQLGRRAHQGWTRAQPLGGSVFLTLCRSRAGMGESVERPGCRGLLPLVAPVRRISECYVPVISASCLESEVPSLHGVFPCPSVTGAVKAQIIITINMIIIIITIVTAFFCDVPSLDTQSRTDFLIFTLIWFNIPTFTESPGTAQPREKLPTRCPAGCGGGTPHSPLTPHPAAGTKGRTGRDREGGWGGDTHTAHGPTTSQQPEPPLAQGGWR